ncbi:MAG: ferrous iron transport protein A [Chloroherpetonaceae bacterium]|nr:ferrous iron transport protein A [Chloroherpetonaceae bacterium]
MSSTETVTLNQIKKGMKFRVKRIADPSVRTQLIRFGVGEGSTAHCFERIPFGPIIIKHGRQEVALGRDLTYHIWVEVLN